MSAGLERYVAMVAESGADAVILLSKADLCDPSRALRDLRDMDARLPATVAFQRSNPGHGLALLDPYLQKEKTVALIGSSGVGKSTLINKLCGTERQKVQAIRDTDDRGMHTTTARRMIMLPQGCLLIDTLTPANCRSGMRKASSRPSPIFMRSSRLAIFAIAAITPTQDARSKPLFKTAASLPHGMKTT